ncbi:MAG: SusC/RagA family TonB-linked outer membrane protein [Paludibacteraceae bacterium]
MSGKVTSSDGQPLIGVTVRVTGANISGGTLTDGNGYFSITAPDGAVGLQFTYLGMKPVSVRLDGRSSFNIVMEDDAVGLNEVVAIGYGVTRKSDLTGSVASVKAEDLITFPATNVAEMLRGQAAGVQVTSSSGSPGSASSILIRGNRSLSSNQSPLFLVDGMIVPNINDLNATDIESIEVLKDASSQAIYGARAANGVIMVTTKRGKAGKVTVDLNSYVGFQQVQRNFDFYSPDEWVKLRFWAKYNEGTSGIGTPDNIDYQTVINDQTMWDTYNNKNYVDWEKLTLGNALQSKHDVSLRGGNEKIKFSLGLGYLDQNGVVDKSGYKRGSVRLNTDAIITNWLDLGVNFSYTKANTLLTNSNFDTFITMPPLSQAYEEDGVTLRRVVTDEGTINPLWRIAHSDSERNDDFLVASLFTNIKPFKGFNYRFSANVRTNSRETGSYQDKFYPSSTGNGTLTNFNRFSWMIDNVVSYELPFDTEDHKLTLTLIQTAEEELQKSTSIDFINATTDLFKWNVVENSEILNVDRSITRTRSASYAARLQYNLLERYLLTASIRRDGASVFGTENKWASFPSVAFAWRINDEPFMVKTKDWLDMFKLRLSYGVVGNWAIPAYRTLGLANSYEYLANDQLTINYLPSRQLQNLGLKWENTNSFNAGVDFMIFKGRVNTTLEYYRTNTNNLLIQRTIPAITSYTSMWDNLGKTQSSGWEFSLDTRIIDQRDFKLNVGGNISTQKNKIVAIDGRVDENGDPINDLGNNWFIGKPINVNYDYVFNGIWQEDEIPNITEKDYLPGSAAPSAGNVKLLDYNGDGAITIDDRKIYTLDPQWYASFNVNALLKGFDISAEFYTVQGITRRNTFMYLFEQGGSLNGRYNGMKVNYWTPENKSNEAPRPQYTGAVPFHPLLAYQDASYFRLRNLTLGYTFNKNLTKKISIEKLRLYATGTNIFTMTKFKSYSPESNASNYPEAQVFTFGLNITF